jgi:hypothetical protein
MIVEAAVDYCRDPPHRLSVAPRQEMRDLGVLVVGMLLCKQTYKSKQSITEQVAAQGRCPARVAAVETPGEIGK